MPPYHSCVHTTPISCAAHSDHHVVAYRHTNSELLCVSFLGTETQNACDIVITDEHCAGDYPNDNEIPDLCSHFAGVQLKALTPFGENILFVIRMMFAMIPLSFLLDPLLVEFASYFLAPHVATADVRREHPVPWKTQVKMISFQV